MTTQLQIIIIIVIIIIINCVLYYCHGWQPNFSFNKCIISQYLWLLSTELDVCHPSGA